MLKLINLNNTKILDNNIWNSRFLFIFVFIYFATFLYLIYYITIINYLYYTLSII